MKNLLNTCKCKKEKLVGMHKKENTKLVVTESSREIEFDW